MPSEEARRTRILMEEQVRLQKEANELEKKKLALEEEKIKQGRQGQGYSPSPTTSPPPVSSWEESDDDDDDDITDSMTNAEKIWFHNCDKWVDRIARILKEEQPSEARMQKIFRAIEDRLGQKLTANDKIILVGLYVECSAVNGTNSREKDEVRRQERVRNFEEECAKRHVRLNEKEKQILLLGKWREQNWWEQEDDNW